MILARIEHNTTTSLLHQYNNINVKRLKKRFFDTTRLHHQFFILNLG
jgi:hypothetical protein